MGCTCRRTTRGASYGACMPEKRRLAKGVMRMPIAAGRASCPSSTRGVSDGACMLEQSRLDNLQRVATDMTFLNPESESRILLLKPFAGLFLGRPGKKSVAETFRNRILDSDSGFRKVMCA